MIWTEILELLADFKIDNFDFIAIAADEDIIWFEIAMANTFRMQVTYSKKDFL